MKPEILAQARRFYHHVLHGGTLRPEDVAFMVEALEEAAHQRKWARLTDKEIEDISDRIKGDELLVETSTWHVRYARALERKLKEKNT